MFGIFAFLGGLGSGSRSDAMELQMENVILDP